jgi:Tfp pilus assembly protein FimT
MKQPGNGKMEEGYFLVNIMVTIAIIGLIGALSIPYIRNVQPAMELNAAQKQITSDLRFAQQSAVTQQVIYSVKFYIDSNDYDILEISSGATSTVAYKELPDDINIDQVSGSGDNEVEFNFYGGVDEPCQVILSNSRGRTGNVNIKPSGYIEMQ